MRARRACGSVPAYVPHVPHVRLSKAIACKTPDELLELAQEEGIELTDAQLEGISGGGWSEPSCGDDTAWTYAC